MSKLECLCCKFMAETRNLQRVEDYKRSYAMRSLLFEFLKTHIPSGGAVVYE